jgi:hypothetical protein
MLLTRQYYSSRHFRKMGGKQGTEIKEKKGEGGRGREEDSIGRGKRGAGREDRMGEEKGTGEGGKKH